MRTLVGLVLEAGGKLPRIAGVTMVYACVEAPIVFVDASVRALPSLRGAPGVVSCAPVQAIEYELARGVDQILQNASALSRTAVNGFSERIGTELAGLWPPYPVLRGPTGEIDWDTDTKLVTPQCIFVALNLSKEDPDSEARWDAAAPLPTIIRAAADRLLVVVAAGNFGRDSPNDNLSALARLPSVIPVGATTDVEGTILAPYSSKGPVGGRGPFVVAFGASELNGDCVGTSFSAPRVLPEIAALAAWVKTVEHHASLLTGNFVGGIPLTGVAVLDTGAPGWSEEQLRLPAFPSGAVHLPALSTLLEELATRGATPDFSLTPALLAKLLAGSARAMPRYLVNEVGYGFVSSGTTLEFLRGFRAIDFIDCFCPSIEAGTLPEDIEKMPIANLEVLPVFLGIWYRATLHLYVEHDTRRATLN